MMTEDMRKLSFELDTLKYEHAFLVRDLKGLKDGVLAMVDEGLIEHPGQYVTVTSWAAEKLRSLTTENIQLKNQNAELLAELEAFRRRTFISTPLGIAEIRPKVLAGGRK
jgi:hypothetical protein